MLVMILSQSEAGWCLCFVPLVAVVVLVATLRKSKRRCPRCAEINPRHARFCAHCGTSLGR